MRNYFSAACIMAAMAALASCGGSVDNVHGINEIYSSSVIDSANQRIEVFRNADSLVLAENYYLLDSLSHDMLLYKSVALTYDSSGMVESQLTSMSSFDDFTLRPVEMAYFEYDTLGHQTKQIYQVSDGSIDHWTNVTKNQFWYLGDNMVCMTHYTWQPGSQSWWKLSETQYLYDSLGNKIYMVLYELDPNDTTKIIKNSKILIE